MKARCVPATGLSSSLCCANSVGTDSDLRDYMTASTPDPTPEPSADISPFAETAGTEAVLPSLKSEQLHSEALQIAGSPAADPEAGSKVAVVTGAARRVGSEIALSLARHGYAVVVHHGTSAVEASVLVNRIRSEGGRAVAVSADLREPRAAAAAVFQAAEKLGPVSVLINSAAVFQDRALPWIDAYHCNVHLSVNLLAPVFLAQQFIRQLAEGEPGHIINILDWRAQRPGPDHLIYTASKAALASVTKSLAQQLAPGIQVNGIAPGAILPPEDRSNWHQQRAIESIPLKRTGSPGDVCDAIHFLLKSRFITGEILHVSGGEEL
jgi:pteridine reductase